MCDKPWCTCEAYEGLEAERDALELENAELRRQLHAALRLLNPKAAHR